MLNITISGCGADAVKEGLQSLAENRGFIVSDDGISVEVISEKLLWFGGDDTEGMLLETFFYDSMHI